MKRKSIFPFIYLCILTILAYVPIVVAVVYSFNESKSTSVWTGFTLKWYQEVLADKTIMPALINSIVLGFIASLLSAIVATAAALGFRKRKSVYAMTGEGKLTVKIDMLIRRLSMLPMIIPEIILAVAYLAFFNLIGLPFGMLTLIPAHMSFCIPYVFMQIEPVIMMMDEHPNEAARVMGAGLVRAYLDTTLPYLAPSVLSGIFLSFAMSFDDVIISMFMTGTNVNTLSLKIYSQVKTSITPKVNALCTLILSGMIVCIIISGLLGKKSRHTES